MVKRSKKEGGGGFKRHYWSKFTVTKWGYLSSDLISNYSVSSNNALSTDLPREDSPTDTALSKGIGIYNEAQDTKCNGSEMFTD